MARWLALCRRCRLECCALLVAACGASAQDGLTGYLEYQGRREAREGREATRADLVTLRADGSTPIRESWLAHFSAGLGLTFNRTSEDGLSQTGSDITGGARLRILPRSPFPFEAYAERRDSRVDGELTGPNYTQTLYGFTQTYTPAVGAHYLLAYRRTERTDERLDLAPAQSRTAEDFVSLAVNRAFERHQLDFNGDYDRIVRDNPAQADQRTIGVLRHRYSPGATLSLDTLASSVDSRIEQDPLRSQAIQRQLSSNLFWRPATAKPLIVSGSLLASDFDDSAGAAATGNRLLLLSGSANYQTTPSLAWRGSAAVSENRTGTTERRTSLAKTGLTYAPPEIALAKWTYRYALLGDVASRTDSAAESVQEASASISHSLGRTRRLWGGSAGLSAAQQLATIRDTAQRVEDSLVHSLSADFSATRVADSFFARALASDTRRIDGSDIAFQLVNLQVNGIHQRSRMSSWSGSATVQWTRNSSEEGATPWLGSASASLTYRHERVFGVPLLRFTSELRVLSDDLARVSTDAFDIERRESASWSNRLDYAIGRTQLSLRGLVAEVDDRRYALAHLQVRRYFGRLAQ